MTLVSVVLPTHNSERWVADTIDSLIGQTWPDIELIVVDDGSRDGTEAVARLGRGLAALTGKLAPGARRVRTA